MTQRDSDRTTTGRFITEADIEAIADDVVTREFDHPQPKVSLAGESAMLEADEVDRVEMRAVAQLMASLRTRADVDQR